ncbi:MAG TPA: DUF2207 domain-containing protein [Burkholderiales bacterium]
MRVLLLLAAALALPAAAQERVVDFHSDIRIARDGTLTVTERIDVQVEGREIKRGILRDFPTDYRDRSGARVRVPFEVLRVTRNGALEPWRQERLANGERVRIGNAAVILPHGRHVYEVSYRTWRQLGFFGKHDELYWNVNGNGWTFAMDRIRADVTLPAAVPAEKLQLEAYTGLQGARGRDYEAQARDSGASFQTTRALGASQGLTIVVMFPKGVVAEPGMLKRLGWWIGDNKGAATGIGALLALFWFLWWRWSLVGRDPRAGPAFPRYVAPPGLGPAGVRFIDRMKYDTKCMAASLVGLGARGFLKIRQAGDAYLIERTGQEPAEWFPGERSLAALLPGKPGTPVALAKAHNQAVQTVSGMVERELAVLYEERLFSRNRGSHVAGIGIAVAGVAAMVITDTPASLMIPVIVVMMVVLAVFARLLPAYSVEGRKLQDAIVGLRQYLSIAEKEDLARLKAPPQTAEEFTRFLPYAVALDVEEAWTRRFTQVLGAAAVAAAAGAFYSSGNGSGFSGSGLSNSIGGLSDTVSSASTPPGSSSGGSGGGGGGGGSSGGGGGGGGGSGW